MRTTAPALGFILSLGLAATACEQAQAPTALAPTSTAADQSSAQTRLNILLDQPVTDEAIEELSAYGTITGRLDAIHAVFMVGSERDLPAIRALPFVSAAGPDAPRSVDPPVNPLELDDHAGGLGSWNLDAVDVMQTGFVPRDVSQTGDGVYVGVLDTGFLRNWRDYFPEERIAVEHARSYAGGGAMDEGSVAEQPIKWERDTHGHGTHVTSTILGYDLRGTSVNGVASRSTVIPVKVLDNDGSGWASMTARGMVYMGELKAGPLADHPVVVNMSFGGSELEPVERAAIEYAIEQGVILVAAAGNRGENGMTYPAAYPPVISAAAAGWVGQWLPGPDGDPFNWWFADDVPDPTDADDFYIIDFSSREIQAGHDLDVAAPGVWVLGPFQLDMGRPAYFFLSGTSMASPHVAGIAALMAEKYPALTAAEAESILESTAVPLSPGAVTVSFPAGPPVSYQWGSDATGHGLAVAAAALAATPD